MSTEQLGWVGRMGGGQGRGGQGQARREFGDSSSRGAVSRRDSGKPKLTKRDEFSEKFQRGGGRSFTLGLKICIANFSLY